jgi:hypothetical protein
MADVIDLPTGLTTPMPPPVRQRGPYKSKKIVPYDTVCCIRNRRREAAAAEAELNRTGAKADNQETIDALERMLQEARRGKLRDLGAVFLSEGERHAVLCDGLLTGDRKQDLFEFVGMVMEVATKIAFDRPA